MIVALNAEDTSVSRHIANTIVSSIPNRTIKFRAWDGVKIYLPEYSDEDDFYLSPEGEIKCQMEVGYERHLSNYRRDKNWILMQFTGLQDKNGIDIYEGDIVKQEKWVRVGEYSPAIGIVKYNMVKFTCECIGDWLESNADLNGNAEVIGNVFQNSELLG